MRITKNTGIIPEGAIVMLPGEEDFYVIKGFDVDEGMYTAMTVEFDGDDYVECGGETKLTPYELIGGEYET